MEKVKYEKQDMGSYNLHLIKTDKFRTVTVRVSMRQEITEENITYRNVLADMLVYSNASYKTKRELVMKEQELYSAHISANSSRSGMYNNINFQLKMLLDKYTEEGIEEESIKFFSDILFNPNVTDKKFDSTSFEIIKKENQSIVESYKENSSKYSIIRLLQNMEDKPYKYIEYGKKEVLAKMTEESLYAFYQDFFNKSLVDIYVIGNIDLEKYTKLIKKYFLFDTFKRKKISPIIPVDKYNKRSKTVVEQEDISQSKLSIGCKIEPLSEFDRNYTLTLYNLILGGSSESKFFKNIREKHSLCYYVSSSIRKLDNLMIIKAGISKENFKETVKRIKKEMKDMTLGKFDEVDIENAVNNYISALNEIEDFSDAIIETYVAKDLLNLDDIKIRREKIKQVTKEDIIRVGKAVHMATVYLLEGVKE